MSRDVLDAAFAKVGLQNLGVAEDGHLVLLGPAENFWDIFSESVEFGDGAPDPVDRWSMRVISGLGADLNAEAIFPFGGPPYAPFLTWTVDSGRAWNSPLGMLVHDQLGLMVSYRGALRFKVAVSSVETSSEKPCDSCLDRPCLTACPVAAITADTYDTDRCAQHLKTDAGVACMSGCLVRRACPYSLGAHRDPAQSRLHMEAFLKER